MDEYTKGFGVPTLKSSDFWLGLEALHRLTDDGRMEGMGFVIRFESLNIFFVNPYQAKIELIDWENEQRMAYYGKFAVDSGIEGYRLTAKNFRKEQSQGERLKAL